MTSDVFALATAVLFQSPVQHFAMAPNNLQDAPEWAVEFMKNVPTTWDEVKFIDGYPGKYIILARRSGDNWYVAAINAEEAPLTSTIDLPGYIQGKEIAIYSDDKDLKGSLKSVKPNKKGQIKLNVPQNGATLLVY